MLFSQNNLVLCSLPLLTDKSGFLDVKEVENLLKDYGEQATPKFVPTKEQIHWFMALYDDDQVLLFVLEILPRIVHATPDTRRICVRDIF